MPSLARSLSAIDRELSQLRLALRCTRGAVARRQMMARVDYLLEARMRLMLADA